MEPDSLRADRRHDGARRVLGLASAFGILSLAGIAAAWCGRKRRDLSLTGSEGGNREEPVNIALTGDEALVLFEWVSRTNEEQIEVPLREAERRVLWNVEAHLESVLVAPFDHRYDRLLDEARARIVAPDERATS
ncbi:hypothetical protein ACFVAE_15805 [Microbacterium sp. NPDC057659]|uniref:hypothetical protein n=1 Tax=Microbacterium sp. NPDC057659 TaxID=3346198 RepID=UPI00366F4F09